MINVPLKAGASVHAGGRNAGGSETEKRGVAELQVPHVAALLSLSLSLSLSLFSSEASVRPGHREAETMRRTKGPTKAFVCHADFMG